jgi:hypothetical protein
VVEAILYMASTGCQWRAIPKDFPPYSTVQGYFHAWSHKGLLAHINHMLVMALRETAGREASPTAASLTASRSRLQIGEEHLTTPQFLALGSKRLFDLHDQAGVLEYLIRGCDDPGAGRGIFVIADASAIPGEGFDVYAVASGHEFPDGRGNEPGAIFVSFDFFLNADEHFGSQQLVRTIRSRSKSRHMAS